MPNGLHGFEDKRINVAAFTNSMRSLYDLAPSMTALLAILGVLVELTGRITELRGQIMIPALNEMLKRQWDPRMTALRADLNSIMEDVGTHPDESDIPISELRDNIAGALLYGKHKAYWEPDPWMRQMAVVTWAASMWNQLLEVARLNAQTMREYPPGYIVIAESIIMAEKQLSESAPGEDPTIRDKISDGLDDIADGAEDLFKAIAAAAKKVLPYVALGIGVLAGLIILTRTKRVSITTRAK